jgi:molybdenum cofactor guanylyltransferase
MIKRDSILGVVLAGGLSRRMASPIPKALLDFQGRAMIAHVLEALAPQVGAIVINANTEPNSFESFGFPVVQDRVAGFVGPLAGLHASMLTYPDYEWYVMCPCDSPFLTYDLVPKFCASIESTGAALTSAECEGQTHPVFAMVHRKLLPSLSQYLSDDGRKIDRWYAQEGYQLTHFTNAQGFLNFNTPEELAAYNSFTTSSSPTRNPDRSAKR